AAWLVHLGSGPTVAGQRRNLTGLRLRDAGCRGCYFPGNALTNGDGASASLERAGVVAALATLLRQEPLDLPGELLARCQPVFTGERLQALEVTRRVLVGRHRGVEPIALLLRLADQRTQRQLHAEVSA